MMNKSISWMSMIFIVLVIAGLLLNSGSSVESNINGAGNAANVQVVKMHVEGAQYIFEPSTVKKGIPVRLEADVSRMPGCSKGTISTELGITKTFSSNNNTVEFTPNKAGIFYFSCSMNMYKGTLTVLESDGSKSNYVQTPSTSGASCGVGGKGCGCGG